MLLLVNAEAATTSRAARALGLALGRRAHYRVVRNPQADLFTAIRVQRARDEDLGRFTGPSHVRYFLHGYSAT
jgi:hypothetical protein